MKGLFKVARRSLAQGINSDKIKGFKGSVVPGLTEPWLEHYPFGHAYGFHISQREGKVSRPRVKAAISPLYLRHSPKQSLNELLELMS